jgi:group I intron endonuclease
MLCNNIIGTSVKSGIYKITNQKNNICYIGQAVDLATRWKQHAKCGLGIDTPQSNKLYKAMKEDGLWNFSFEVLEFCTSAELNEKEKYYIELYQSKDYGYNSNQGVGK